jgi:hypothetical protein
MKNLEKLYPDVLPGIKKEAKKIMLDSQMFFVFVVGFLIALFYLFYLLLVFHPFSHNYFDILWRIIIVLAGLVIISVILKKKILPLGKITRKDLRRACNCLYYSTETMLKWAESANDLAEIRKKEIEMLEGDINGPITHEGQKLLIEKKRAEVKQYEERARMCKRYALFLEEVFKK